MSRRTGVKIETIRYYERIGLLAPPPRTPGGYRDYDDAARKRLCFIRRARELGFTLDEVRMLLSLADGEAGPCAVVEAMTRRHLADVRARIADLRRLESTLDELARRCATESDPRCPVIEALLDDPASLDAGA
ncbi:MAG: helix-turn-helix domain-containing protein [Rhodothalassiaceae bacterium]